MPTRETGRYEITSTSGENVRAFVPHALPPAAPPIVVEGELAERLRVAEQALVRLELAGEMVPSLDWFIYAFVPKEAVLSSQIEGTQATLMDLLNYEAEGNDLPHLIRAGLLHVQFETIHPYLDGNGRIGRLLVTLLLEHWHLLSRPLLYLSLFFKRHRQEYYRRLNAVRDDGDWEGWLDFFLDGVTTIANEAVTTTRDLFSMIAADRQRLIHQADVNLLAVQLFESLPSRPIISAPWVVEAFSTTKPTAGRAIEALEAAGILVETSGRKRDRVYAYEAYLDRLRTGTELGEE